MRDFISQRHTPSSPSLILEQGVYRIRTNRGSPSKTRHRHVQRHSGQLSAYDKGLLAMMILLIFASACCFGYAYYLLNTGWVAHSLQRHEIPVSDLPLQTFQVVEFDRELGNSAFDGSTKYLSYLPHSGFHNQRIALENALIMANILNRTLLVPPVRLGKGTLTYYTFNHLYELVSLSGKDGLGHCADSSLWRILPVECTDYYDYTMIPWNWISNITAITSAQPIIQRWNMTDAWLVDHLGIRPNETFAIKDTNPYQFRFVDADPLDMPGSRFQEQISMALLSQLPHRLIQVGTLFGSSRLRLRRRRNLDYRTLVRQSMSFTNDILLDLAESMKMKMGGEYVAAHIRIGDGTFERKAAKNVRMIWWRLVREVLGVKDDVALAIEKRSSNSSLMSPPAMRPDPFAHRKQHMSVHPLPSTILPQIACRRPRYEDPRLAALNVPLFISTDVTEPSSHPLLRRFFDTFPCTFVLSDFIDESTKLGRLKSGYDGLMLKEFVVPIVDAIMAGKAHDFVGTEGSTFSQFVQDVLWRRYKGWEIVQRG